MVEAEVRSNLQALFDALIARGRDTEPAMKQIGRDLHASVEENFEVEGRPAWKPLSLARIKQRTKAGTWPGKILQEFRGLRLSITSRATKDSAIVGTNKVYAGPMQKDRPYLVIQEQDIVSAEVRLLRHLLK